MTLSRTIFFSLALSVVMMGSCSSANRSANTENAQNDTLTKVIDFNADSAYSYVKAQCDFGPRVPNTKAHSRTADYLIAKLKSFGANVIVQDPELTAFDGTKIQAKNIIGEFGADKDKRILLLAHWDSRPLADADKDAKKISQPVMGANDGASGVGVLLEMARLFSQKSPNIGVDILFVDAEDWGNSGASSDADDTWALGTQYWIKNMHHDGYKPLYGILLDMVGARGAQFAKEYFSVNYASAIVDEVWNIAQQSGYGNYFIQANGGAITDDHVFVNKAGIPTIDIIHMDQSTGTGFFPQWHTTSDTMDQIDSSTLKAVGQTLTNLIYQY
jgi:Predicted aminopeptidases